VSTSNTESRKSIRGIKPGNVVELQFLDHVQDGKDAIEFRVWGEVLDITRTSIRVACWAHVDKSMRDEPEPFNETTFTIVKKAITAVRVLSEH
jgi:acyl-CoA hydrolase